MTMTARRARESSRSFVGLGREVWSSARGALERRKGPTVGEEIAGRNEDPARRIRLEHEAEEQRLPVVRRWRDDRHRQRRVVPPFAMRAVAELGSRIGRQFLHAGSALALALDVAPTRGGSARGAEQADDQDQKDPASRWQRDQPRRGFGHTVAR